MISRSDSLENKLGLLLDLLGILSGEDFFLEEILEQLVVILLSEPAGLNCD